MKRIFFTIVFALSFAFAVFAQESADADAVNRERRQFPPEITGSYQDWLGKDVAYIITTAEKKAFAGLQTDGERENFVENFWRRRDPDPDTEENEFRDEHYRRIAYANEHFASGIPGWLTDRGRIYIIWGKPDKVEKGYGTFEENLSVPYEKWFYGNIPGCCSGVELTFIDPRGTDEFRIFKPKIKPDSADSPGFGLS